MDVDIEQIYRNYGEYHGCIYAYIGKTLRAMYLRYLLNTALPPSIATLYSRVIDTHE